MLFRQFDIAGIVPEPDAPDPAQVVSGDPRFTTWAIEDGPEIFAGIWEATPGAWRVHFTEWEYCRILSGRLLITDGNGLVAGIGPGGSFVIRPGFRGTWEVKETLRKEYVIRP